MAKHQGDLKRIGKVPTKCTKEEKKRREKCEGLNRQLRKCEAKVNSHRTRTKRKIKDARKKQPQCPIWGDGGMLANFQIWPKESKCAKGKLNDDKPGED